MLNREKEIINALVARASLTDAIVAKGKSDPDFDSILQGLSAIHKGKEVGYGSYKKANESVPVDFRIIFHYADMRRKFIRLENLAMQATKKDGGVDFFDLLDTYSDLAVYAAMGLQMIFDICLDKEEKKAKPPTNFIPRHQGYQPISEALKVGQPPDHE